MNVRSLVSILGIGLVAVLVLGSIIFLVVLAFRRSRSAGGAIAAALFVGLLVALVVPFLFAPRAPDMNANVESTPAPARIIPDDSVSRSTRHDQSPRQYGAVTRPLISQDVYVQTQFPQRRSRAGDMILAAISLAALLTLARVAIDGRKVGGYGAPARVVATLAFIGVLAVLAQLGTILRH